LNKVNLRIADKVIEKIITDYTRESGVRELDRQLASLMRAFAKKVALEETFETTVNLEQVADILGKRKYSNDLYEVALMPGVAVGLAWTYVGGDILFIEASLSKGKGELKLTGNLGNVMKESASTALSYLQANAETYGINPEMFSTHQIHVHVPEGAVPKDGPSAGITMLSALTSALTGKKIKPFLAMTGEITLRGQVLPVGGIKEKVLAAKRAGLKEVMMSSQNEKDVLEIDPRFIKGLKFHYVDRMEEVLQKALMKK
jgi:ATP-dependent Lon protease